MWRLIKIMIFLLLLGWILLTSLACSTKRNDVLGGDEIKVSTTTTAKIETDKTKLEAVKESVLSKEYTVECVDVNCSETKPIVKIEYLDAVELKATKNFGLTEDVDLRTEYSKTYLKSTDKDGTKHYITEVKTAPESKKIEDKWYEIKRDVVEPEAWNDVMNQKTILNYLFGLPAIADSISTSSNNGDGIIYAYKNGTTWAANRAGTGQSFIVEYVGDGNGMSGQDFLANAQESGSGTNYYISARSFFPFYTGSISSDATVSSSSFAFTNYSASAGDNDGQDYIGIMGTTTQPSHTAITSNDWTKCGVVDGNFKSNVTDWDISSNSAAGRYWMKLKNLSTIIKKSGQSSTCGSSLTGWTCLGGREGHDIENATPANNTQNYVFIRHTDYGTASARPALIVEYSIAGAATPLLNGFKMNVIEF